MKSRNQEGFTTVEILVSIIIFAVAMGGLSSALHGTMRANLLATRLTMATNIAQTQLETLQEMPFDEVTSGSTVVVAANSAANSTATSTSDGTTIGNETVGTRYYVQWQVDAGPGGTKDVVVEVSWGQEEHSIELRTLIFG